jgi:hypothetical protein
MNRQRKDEKRTKFGLESLKAKDHLRDLSADGRI